MSRRRQRGVAMILVIIAIAVLTAVATDFAYNSRVDLQMATNQRDELRAYYLAQSGIGLARLVLKFQKQLDGMQIPNLGGMLQALMPSSQAATSTPATGATTGSTAAAPAAMSSPSIQIWKMIHVDCHMLQQLVKSETTVDGASNLSARTLPPPKTVSRKLDFDTEFPELAAAQSRRAFGGFQGCFNAEISDEEEKINLNRLDAPGASSSATAMTLLGLMADKRFEFVFNKEDANKVKVTPQDVLANIRDWIDDDQVQSTLNLNGQGSTDFFIKGFQDENYNYDRYDPRYKAKNAHFDSLDELYFVHGVSDRFMAAFRDRLTVYPNLNRNLNINTDDPAMIYVAILSVTDPMHPDPQLLNPLFVEQLISTIRKARMFSFLGFGVSDFVNLVAASGVPVNQTILANVSGNRFVSDKSETFRIRSVGEAGQVSKAITAVVRLDDRLGKLVYWKEE